MFSNQMQVMLYVDDVTKAVEFWQELGFAIIEQQTVDGTSVVEIAPSKEAEAHFVLYGRTTGFQFCRSGWQLFCCFRKIGFTDRNQSFVFMNPTLCCRTIQDE